MAAQKKLTHITMRRGVVVGRGKKAFRGDVLKVGPERKKDGGATNNDVKENWARHWVAIGKAVEGKLNKKQLEQAESDIRKAEAEPTDDDAGDDAE